MPKRVIDFDALWASDKLASCAEWAQSEYAWLYGLADASGSFEITNLRVIWGRVAAIRKNLTLERLREIFDEFIARGLLFTWEQNGKRYGHWTGSDVPGRLPPPSWRMRLQKLAPPVPREALAAYSARFGGSKEGIASAWTYATAAPGPAALPDAQTPGLKRELEEPPAQDLGLGLDLDWEKEKQVCPFPPPQLRMQAEPYEPEPQEAMPLQHTPEDLLEIYEAERGELPAAGGLTPERRRRGARWLAAGFTPEEFRAAVRRAAATPFLAGAGDRGWRASFDWLIANRSNARKVLEGEYAPPRRTASGRYRAERGGLPELYAGTGPRPADFGVHVNPAVWERIRARQARLASPHAQDLRALGAPEGAPAPSLARGAASTEAPELAPKPVAFDAQPRASPAVLES